MLMRYLNKRNISVFSFIVFLICLVYFFFCNYFFPMMSDDYAISFVWDGNHGGNIAGIQPRHMWQRIESISDIFTSLASMYMTWGGRMESWFIAQFFLWLGKPTFNAFNTIIFCIFMLLIARISLGRYYLKNGWYILWIFSGLWLVNYAFYNTTLWISGSANYLWLMCFQLLFILPYVEAIRGYSLKIFQNDSLTIRAGMILVGLLAGNTNENSAAAVLIAAAWIYYKIRQSWMAYGLLGILIGYAILIFAPGNYVRYHVVLTAGEGDYLPLIPKLIVFAWLLLKEIPLFFLLTPYLNKKVRQKCKFDLLKKEYHLILLFTFMGFLSALTMFAAPMIPPRSFFGTSVFLLIAGTISIRLMSVGDIGYYRRFIKWVACIMLAIFTLYTTAISLYAETLISKGYQDMVDICMANPNGDVVIPWRDFPLISKEVQSMERFIINHDNFGNCIGHIRPDSDQWMNQAVAAYYQLNSIRIDISD